MSCQVVSRQRRLLNCLAVWLIAVAYTDAASQDPPDLRHQDPIHERFMEVLLRRPRLGTALDRVYDDHFQAGTIDEFVKQLESAATHRVDDAGPRTMLLGLIEMQRGRDAEAIAALTRAEPLLVDDAMVSYYLGKSLLQVGRMQEAAAAFQRALDRDPERGESLPIFTELARLYHRIGRTEDALQVWNELEHRFPGDGRIGEKIAAALAEEGQLHAALQRYESLAKRSDQQDDFGRIRFLVAAAELKHRLGQHADATADLEKILTQLRPGSWLHQDVRRRIEAGFLRSGDFGALADYYEAQTKKHPNEMDVQLRFGHTLAKAKRFAQATEVLSELVGRAPENVDLRLALIDVYKATGDSTKAAKQFESLAKLDPTNPDYLMQWGDLMLEGHPDDPSQAEDAAAKIWHRLAEDRNDDPVVSAQVADRMREIQRSDDAIQLYQRAIELSPNEPQFREYLGEYLHRLDRKEEALAMWTSMAEGDRRSRDTLIRLAEVLMTFQFPNQALDAFAAAAEYDLSFSQRLRYVDVLLHAEKYERALKQLDVAEELSETPEEHEQLLRSRIDVYVQSKTLDDRIMQAREQLEKDPDHNDNARRFRRLAMMLDAVRRSSEATLAIEDSLRLSPSDTFSLAIAAEMYVNSGRYIDAVNVYQRLARIDQRHRSSYLQSIAALQVRLGQIEQALETAAEWIELQTGNSQPYHFYADLCFQAGRDEEGIEALRRALRIFHRDDETRHLLAKTLANRGHTEEAIELYWQSFEATDDFDERKWIVAELAPLYQLNRNLSHLITRLEEVGQKESDMRTATFLVAEAQRVTNDLRSASQTLQPMLLDNPRDAELLQLLVLLAVQAEDFRTAIEYQERLADVADTRENRRTVLSLMIRSGQTTQIEEAIDRVQGFDDPSMMVSLIDNLINRGDYGAAIRISQLTLQYDDDLWEVKVRLAFVMVLTNRFDEAIELTDAIRRLRIADDTPPASRRGSFQHASAAPPAATTKQSRFFRSQSCVQFAEAFGIGGYTRTANRIPQSRALQVATFGEAKFAALAIRLAAAEKQGNLDRTIESIAKPEEAIHSNNIEALWLAFEALSIRASYAPNSVYAPNVVKIPNFSRLPRVDDADQLIRISWRLAAIDLENGREDVLQQLAYRHQERYLIASSSNAQIPALDPLTDEQLVIIRRMMDSTSEDSQTLTTPIIFPYPYLNSDAYSRYLRSWVYDEFVAAGKTDAANEILDSLPKDPKSLEDALVLLTFFALQREETKVNELLGIVKLKLGQWADEADSAEIAELQQLFPLLSMAGTHRHLADLMIAVEVLMRSSNLAQVQNSIRSQRSTVRIPFIRIGRLVGANTEFLVPISQRILSMRFVSYACMCLPLNDPSDERHSLLAYLHDDVVVFADHPDRSAIERKLRRVFAAYATWWSGDRNHAHQLISKLCDDFPDDIDLRSERDRMAQEIAAESADQGEIPTPSKINIQQRIKIDSPRGTKTVNPFDQLRRKGLHP